MSQRSVHATASPWAISARPPSTSSRTSATACVASGRSTSSSRPTTCRRRRMTCCSTTSSYYCKLPTAMAVLRGLRARSRPSPSQWRWLVTRTWTSMPRASSIRCRVWARVHAAACMTASRLFAIASKSLGCFRRRGRLLSTGSSSRRCARSSRGRASRRRPRPSASTAATSKPHASTCEDPSARRRRRPQLLRRLSWVRVRRAMGISSSSVGTACVMMRTWGMWVRGRRLTRSDW
mmetsp:Transcript_60901/g.120550  ORF Transcript_60901/g.120550 Transcript_60901/m.120550 type:complete len:236 (+) Transcript_60901:438-1145(+)